MKRKIIWEDKVCKICSIEYKTTYMNKTGLCKKCRMREHNKKNKLSPEQKKKPYPLDDKEKIKRYRRLKREFAKAQTREEQKQLISNAFEYIVESGIYLWCIDRRTEENVQRETGKKGRKAFARTEPNLKHPSTKGMLE